MRDSKRLAGIWLAFLALFAASLPAQAPMTAGLHSPSRLTKSNGFHFLKAGRWLQPYNYHAYEFGHSRVEQGYKVNGTYSGGVSFSQGLGAIGMLGPLMGHVIRYGTLQANAGGPGQRIDEIFAYPRIGANTIDLDQVAQNEAAIIVFDVGANSAGTSAILPGGAGRTQIQDAINALTNPGTTWPPKGSQLTLSGGFAKNIIIIAELPRGLASDGTSNNRLTATGTGQAQDYEAFVNWLLTFDYQSGSANANPRVAVVDTYHSPLLLDTTGLGPCGASNAVIGVGPLCNLQGVWADGIHPGPPGTEREAIVEAAKLSGLFANPTPFAEVPTTATASNYINNNPTLDTAGAAVGSIAIANMAITGPLFAPGTTVLAFGTSGTTGTGSNNGTYALSSNATATASSAIASAGAAGSATELNINTTAGSNIITVTAIWSGGPIVAGSVLGAAQLPRGWRMNGSGSSSSLSMDIQLNPLGGANGNEMVVHITGTSGASAPSLSFDNNVSSILSTVDMSTALLRQTVNLKWTAGTANSLASVRPVASCSTAGGFVIGNGALAGNPGGYGGSQPQYRENLRNSNVDTSFDTYRTFTTPTFTASNQSLTLGTHPTGCTTSVIVTLLPSAANDNTIYISQSGLRVVND